MITIISHSGKGKITELLKGNWLPVVWGQGEEAEYVKQEIYYVILFCMMLYLWICDTIHFSKHTNL